MKPKLYKTALLLLLASLVGVIAVFGWPQYVKHAEESTLQSVGRHSHEITAVEVLRLTETGDTGPAGSVLVHYHDSRRGVASRQTLVGQQASDLVRHWGQVRFTDMYMAGCHEPRYVLRFVAGRQSILEVAVCFLCENVSWQSAPFTTSCFQMTATAIDKNSGVEGLKSFLTQLP